MLKRFVTLRPQSTLLGSVQRVWGVRGSVSAINATATCAAEVPQSTQSGVEGDAGTAAAAFDRSRLQGTNINPDTLLGTDYLNHFNEVGMLLEMLPEMPDCIAELEDWQPRSYVDHFAWSGLRYSDLAVEAYDAAAPAIREAFEDVVARLNQVVLDAIPQARTAIETEDPGELYLACTVTAQAIRGLIDEASSVINGVETTEEAEADPGHAAQDAVNALFD